MDLTPVYRKFILTLASNRTVTAAATRYGMKLGAARFVAGETLAQALDVVKRLNNRGIMATLDFLGEGVYEEHVARGMCDAYLDLLDGIAESGVHSNVSLKLTQMGLSFDRSLTEENIGRIVRKASEHGNFVRIDMEDTSYTDATLEIYRKCRSEGFDNLGTVIQAYLYRTEKDIAELGKINANLRLVKGAYKEPPNLAFPRKADVDENFRKIIRARLTGGFYTGVATHDDEIVNWTKELVREQKIDQKNFEFQMLFGVRMAWQEELAREGYQVRCYVPYGRMWFPYFSRRIAERPGNFWFIMKNMLKG